MAELAQIDWKAKSHEARTRALLEDLVEYHKGVYPHNRLALAIWYAKSPAEQDQNLLELFTGPVAEQFANTKFSLLWKTGSESPPYVNLQAVSVEYFSRLLKQSPAQIEGYRQHYEVVYFDKSLLTPDILEVFKVVTEPTGLMKGWYIDSDEYTRSKSIQELLSIHRHARPHFGLVKIEESSDFENCRGLLNIEANQRWVALSPEGIRTYTYYADYEKGQPVYFLFEGGALFQLLKIEVKTAPEYANRVLEKTRDGRYPEVYLRAVHPSQPAQAGIHTSEPATRTRDYPARPE